MYLQQVARLRARIGRASVPNLAAKQHAVAGLAQDALLLDALKAGLARTGPPTRAVAAWHEVSRPQLVGQIVEIVMGRGDKDRNFYLWVIHDFFGQGQRLPVGVQGLVRATWASYPSRHADAVAVVAVYRLD